MGHLQPKLPSKKVFETLQRYDIRAEEGIVIGPQGKPVGRRDAHGHWVITVWDGHKQPKIRRCHLIWWKYHGEWPTDLIDHRNRIKDDDRINNLRIRSHRQNMSNRVSNGLLIGVRDTQDPELPFEGYIKNLFIGKSLGNFQTMEEANDFYIQASTIAAEAAYKAIKELIDART